MPILLNAGWIFFFNTAARSSGLRPLSLSEANTKSCDGFLRGLQFLNAIARSGSNEGKDRWANLDNGQRSALVCGPRKFDKTTHREAVAVIHASSGLSSDHISLSSVAPDIS
jgi:hypothetical protein